LINSPDINRWCFDVDVDVFSIILNN
jgi:hypothetical protein